MHIDSVKNFPVFLNVNVDSFSAPSLLYFAHTFFCYH